MAERVDIATLPEKEALTLVQEHYRVSDNRARFILGLMRGEHDGDVLAPGAGKEPPNNPFSDLAFDPNQPRDQKGRWSDVPGGASTPSSGSASVAYKPSMSEADAERWAADSKLKDPMFHVTDEDNVPSIKERGFTLGWKKSFGSVWGTGIYVTPDRKAAEFYEIISDYPQRMELRVNVEKPLMIDLSAIPDDFDGAGLDYAAHKLPGGEKRFAELQKVVEPSRTEDTGTAALKAQMQENGFDALYIIDPEVTQEIGGTQVVVFDPKKVVVVSG